MAAPTPLRARLSAAGVPAADSIQVVVRLRPLPAGEPVCLERDAATHNAVSLATADGRKSYAFDAVLDAGASQADVYASTTAPLVAQVLGGTNGTLVCYGRTGSGKTHTTLGDAATGGAQPGLVHMAAAQLFDAARTGAAATAAAAASSSGGGGSPSSSSLAALPLRRVSVRMQCLEVYNVSSGSWRGD
jgi:hypothetical protein